MSGDSHTYQGADYPQRIALLNSEMVQALHQAGAGILLGTDAAQAYHVPGFSIHEELVLLVDAGLRACEKTPRCGLLLPRAPWLSCHYLDRISSDLALRCDM